MPTVRAATRDDVPGILEIYNEAVLHSTASYDYEPRSLEAGATWWEEHVRGRWPVFVAEGDAKRILGWSSLSQFNPKPGYRFTAENSVYVGSVHWGQGIGTLLMAPLVEAARDRGVRAIIAIIDGGNEASVRLHARFGFKPVARFEKIGFKFDRWLDVVYMQLSL